MEHSGIGFIQRRMAVALANATEIGLQWVEVAGGELDPTTGSVVGGAKTVKTEAVHGLVSFPGAKSVAREFVEVAVGDCIAALPAATVLEGRAGLRFQINGEWWALKELSEKLAGRWDAVARGERLYRAVLLRKAG